MMSDDKKLGRPPIYNKRMDRKNVVLDDWTMQYCRDIADGDLSAGIRKAALESAAYRLRKSRDDGEVK